jgi:hypothetical protein
MVYQKTIVYGLHGERSFHAEVYLQCLNANPADSPPHSHTQQSEGLAERGMELRVRVDCEVMTRIASAITLTRP